MALGVPFGTYRLVHRIARGGMAEVFLAWQMTSSYGQGSGQEDRPQRSLPEDESFLDRTTGIRFTRYVALKRILPHLSESEEFRALFLQEARLASMLSHPHVVNVLDFGRIRDHLFLAMELIEGISLATLIGAGPPLPIEHAVRIVADCLCGLHHAHSRLDGTGRSLQIVHRDVSPSNLMITIDGVVKVLDFGIAKAAWSSSETRPGVVRGKYGYMSPEQAEGARLDGRSDLYAVGVCLYELLTGVPLLSRELSPAASLSAVRSGAGLAALQEIDRLRPDVPRELLAILRRALAPRREQRYSAASEMQLELERFLKGYPMLSSALLLAEYLREHHGEAMQGGRALLSGGAGPGPEGGQTTPVATPMEAEGVVDLAELVTTKPSVQVNFGALQAQGRSQAEDQDQDQEETVVGHEPDAATLLSSPTLGHLSKPQRAAATVPLPIAEVTSTMITLSPMVPVAAGAGTPPVAKAEPEATPYLLTPQGRILVLATAAAGVLLSALVLSFRGCL